MPNKVYCRNRSHPPPPKKKRSLARRLISPGFRDFQARELLNFLFVLSIWYALNHGWINKNDLAQMNEDYFKSLDKKRLVEVAKNLHQLAAELWEKQQLNSENSSQPPSSDNPYVSKSRSEETTDYQGLEETQEPNQKKAERALRHAVIARQIGYGTRTREGSLAYSSLLSVIETCRLRQVNPWTYIASVIALARKGLSPPLLSQPT